MKKIKDEEEHYVPLPKIYEFKNDREKEILLNRNFKRVNQEVEDMVKEMLGMRLCVLHNLYFYNHLMEDIMGAIDAGNYKSFKDERLYLLKTYDKK